MNCNEINSLLMRLADLYRVKDETCLACARRRHDVDGTNVKSVQPLLVLLCLFLVGSEDVFLYSNHLNCHLFHLYAVYKTFPS